MDPAARTRVKRVAAVVLAAGVAGFSLLVLSEATPLDVAGIVLLGVALVVAVSAVFYEVGASEDRERRRERREP
jgi:membrane protein implicated in regulation of membrane protease activity